MEKQIAPHSFVTKKVTRWNLRPYGSLRDGALRGALRADGAIGSEHFGIGGLTRIEADTMTLPAFMKGNCGQLLPLRISMIGLAVVFRTVLQPAQTASHLHVGIAT